MDSAVPRSIARLQYAAARLPFTLLDEWFLARYLDQDALVRTALERWLGSMDMLVGQILDDETISRRGMALRRPAEDSALADERAWEGPARPVVSSQILPEARSGDLTSGARPTDDPAPRPSRQTAKATSAPRQPAKAPRQKATPASTAGQKITPASSADRKTTPASSAGRKTTPMSTAGPGVGQPQLGGADDFLSRVQKLGEMGSREEAETATRLTLSALGERISGGQAADLASALPGELRPSLERTAEPAQAFGIEEFLRRIADPQQTDPRTARRQAKAVLRAVREYAPGKEIADTVAQLPSDLAALLA